MVDVDEDGTINCLSFQQVDFHIYSSCILRCSNSLYSVFMKEGKSKVQTDVREFSLSAFKRSHKCAFLIVVAFVFVFLYSRICLQSSLCRSLEKVGKMQTDVRSGRTNARASFIVRV